MKETYAHIDELVRDRLNELPLAAAPVIGWDALERSLDASEDAHLRHTLTGLAATEAATGWQVLESKLDQRTLMDAQLANQLNQLKPTVAVGSWGVLAARLDGETNAAVDVIVSDGLARTTPVVSSGWAALAARLELIGWRRSTVAAWKVTEGSLLLSLLLLFFRFGPEVPHVLGPVVDLHDGFPVPTAAAASQMESETITVLENVTDGVSTIGVANEPMLRSGRLSAPKISMALPTLGTYIQQPNMARAQVQETVSGSMDFNKPYLPESVAVLEIRPLKNKVYVPSLMFNIVEVDNPAPVYYYANGFISPLDVNQVVTPGHSAGEYDISSERRYTTGFTAGGLLDINKGRNTLQIGIVYSRRAYLPASLKWRYQDYYTLSNPVEGYSKFVYHAIEFPFSYKFTLSENDRWRVSARAGMSLSVIAKPEIKDQEEVVANFEDFEDQIAADGFSLNNNFVPNGRPQGASLPQSDFSSERELKDTPKGWLEGGSILANSSFYLGGGVTVERIINSRWSIYLSPSIGRVIYLRDDDGIGPYRDRINLGSLRMGSRYRFGGKK
ncbi:MAG: hypothetical protein OTI34_03375 [Lewinella sp.]|nr:hypothetical protein [Lewinella sp.]